MNKPNNTKIPISYESLWKAIIRPPKDDYAESQLGESCFVYYDRTYIRHDYKLMNKRGNIIKCSFLEYDIDERKDYFMPVVIFLHGNSSSRLEGLKCSPELLKKDINIFTFDFAGCGQSEGDYITLGWNEKEDVRIVVDFVQKLPGVSNIGLWGRSMGAATTMFYASTDDRIKAICMDSPFGDFHQTAKELCKKYVNLPDFLVEASMNIVKGTVKDKCNLNIDKLQPKLFASKTKTPAFFIHAVNDELISIEQTIKLYESYAGEKTLNVVEGGHNSARQKHILEKIAKFFNSYLYKDYDTAKMSSINETNNFFSMNYEEIKEFEE